jgi:hypothetical protein
MDTPYQPGIFGLITSMVSGIATVQPSQLGFQFFWFFKLSTFEGKTARMRLTCPLADGVGPVSDNATPQAPSNLRCGASVRGSFRVADKPGVKNLGLHESAWTVGLAQIT